MMVFYKIVDKRYTKYLRTHLPEHRQNPHNVKRSDFSDLKLRKFDHRFNCDSPTCTCNMGLESVEHFFSTASFMAIRGCSSTAYQKQSVMKSKFTQSSTCAVFSFMVARASIV